MLANGLDLELEAAGMLPSSLPENLFFFSFLFLNAAATSLNSQAKALFGETLKDSKDTDRDPVLSLPGVIEDLPQDPHYHLVDFNPQDLLLGGLFPIHKREDGGTLCGDIQDEDGDEPRPTKTINMSIITMMMMIIINTDDKDGEDKMLMLMLIRNPAP